MTREEEVEKSIIYHLCQYDYSQVEGKHLDFYIKGFTEGAKWADENPKNVWREADEEPLLENEEIIYVDNTMYAGICSMFGSTFGTLDNDMCWKDYVKHNHIVKWAYINDFLLKGNKDGFKSIL